MINKASNPFNITTVKSAGVALGAIALICGFGALTPLPEAPANMQAQVVPQTVVTADPDGAGPCPEGLPRLQGSIVVDLRDGTTPEEAKAIGRSCGLNLTYNSPYSLESALFTVQVDEANMPFALSLLKAQDAVEACEPNYVLPGFVGSENLASESGASVKTRERNYPNDPLYSRQWNMEMLGVRPAWSWSRGQGAVVAVIDTGVAWQNGDDNCAVEDLAETKIVPGYDFVHKNKLALDDNCHGTHVAGTIAQSTNNNLGVAGIANQAAIMPIKVLSKKGFGNLADIADGIRFAADHHANVMNLSLGGPMPSEVLEKAVNYAEKHGTLVVCAAGNEGRKRPSWPAAYEACLSVASVDSQGDLAWYSNRGKDINISAPGGDMRADRNADGYPDGILQNTLNPKDSSLQGYYAFQGTSMAAPHVSGVAALVASQGITSPQALKRVLLASAESKGLAGRLEGYGAGIVNAENSARKAGLHYGFYRLMAGALLLALPLMAYGRRQKYLEALLSTPFMVLGACGAFFLPLLAPLSSPHSWLVSQAMPAWDLFCFGAAGHGNPIFYSCLIPVALSFLWVGNRYYRAALAGLSAGFAGHFLCEFLAGTLVVQYVPAAVSGIWLLGHAFFLIVMAQVLAEGQVGAEVKQ